MEVIEFKPFEHQDLMIDHMTTRFESLVLAGMGLGKSGSTLKAIDIFMLLGVVRGTIIVAPKRVATLTWPAEIRKWKFSHNYRICDLRPAILSATTKAQKKKAAETRRIWDEGEADIYLVDYANLPKLVQKLIHGREEIHPNAIVFDESHNAKNPASKRINKMRTVMYHFLVKIGLTGTVIPNGYIDLFAQVRLLDGGLALDHRITKYREKYFYNPDKQGFKWLLKEGAKEQIEDRVSHLTITLSSEDWLKIPDIVFNDIEVALPPDAQIQYRKLEKDYLISIDGGDIPAVSAAALNQKLLQLASGTVYDEEGKPRVLHSEKDKALKKLVDKMREQGDTLLIVCFYDHEMDKITKLLPKAVPFKEEDVPAWNRGEIPIWVAKYPSISEGLNLQEGGHNICWYLPTYSYMQFVQLNARLARTGQTHRTIIHRILAKQTADDAAVEALRFKGETERGFMEAMKALEAARA